MRFDTDPLHAETLQLLLLDNTTASNAPIIGAIRREEPERQGNNLDSAKVDHIPISVMDQNQDLSSFK